MSDEYDERARDYLRQWRDPNVRLDPEGALDALAHDDLAVLEVIVEEAAEAARLREENARLERRINDWRGHADGLDARLEQIRTYLDEHPKQWELIATLEAENAALHKDHRLKEEATIETLDVVFDGPPSNEPGRFVEVENMQGASVSAGEWVKRADGYWALRMRVARKEVRIPTPEPGTPAREMAEDMLYRDLERKAHVTGLKACELAMHKDIDAEGLGGGSTDIAALEAMLAESQEALEAQRKEAREGEA